MLMAEKEISLAHDSMLFVEGVDPDFARHRPADAAQHLTTDHVEESLRQHALRLSQRLKNGEMVGTVYRQQMAGKAPLDPCLGILDGLPA
jgi:hypothetical protein